MIGQTISHYKILEKLGEGGMGVVYKAEDTKLERTVALKFLSSTAIGGEEEKKRFKREAKAAAALNHPNIATIFAIDEAEGQTFIAMEFIEGKSLAEMVTSPLPLEKAIDYANQTAAGLQAAHEKGIVHRDIKSANVMVTDKGQVKIMDFGLAKLADRSKMTELGTTLGTAAYVSPEQARGETVDHRADIWSLGVVLYEMISGQLPFKGDYEQAVIYSIQNEDPEPLTALRTGVPIALDGIMTKALAKDPATRYQHVDELPADLKGIEQDLGTTSRISSSRVSGQRPQIPSALERKKRWTTSAVLLIATVVMTSFVIWNLKPHATPPPEPVRRFDITIPNQMQLGGSVYGRDITISPDGQHLVLVASDGQKTQLYHRPLAAYATAPIPGTEGAEPPFFSPDSRWVGKIERGLLKLDETLDIARQTAEGLAKAHEKEIVHRDLKPANVMLTQDGVVKVLDFGLAKLGGLTKLTKEGTTLGTAAYMSPEQARGEKVDHRTDIFSLGVLLYEMLTGQLPFKGDYEAAVMYSLIHEQPTPLAELRADLPAELRDIVSRCLEKQAEDRYESAERLLADLHMLKKDIES